MQELQEILIKLLTPGGFLIIGMILLMVSLLFSGILNWAEETDSSKQGLRVFKAVKYWGWFLICFHIFLSLTGN